MKKLRLKSNHVLLFAVRGKQKFKGFYTPQKGYLADYYELMTAWVADFGPGCTLDKQGVGLGAKVYLKDAFELENLPSYVTEMYAPIVDFHDTIMAEVEKTAGHIQPCVVHEAAIMGVEEDDWTTNPKLSWDKQNLEKPY